MTDRLEPMNFDDLETQLADLSSHVAFPPAPDLAQAVATRLRTGAIAPRTRLLPPVRSLGRSLLMAAVLLLAVVGATLAVRFGLELLSIDRAPLPSPSVMTPSPGASGPVGSTLGLGRQLPLKEVEAASEFDVLVPEALGPPDAVYVGDASLRGQVAFVYAAGDDLRASVLLGGAGLLITQNQGRPDEGLANKIVDSSDATVEPVSVNGLPGVWISGEPHLFWYFAPDGSFIHESRRVVGDTLAWEDDGLLYRIEGAVTLERALEIAASLR